MNGLLCGEGTHITHPRPCRSSSWNATTGTSSAQPQGGRCSPMTASPIPLPCVAAGAMRCPKSPCIWPRRSSLSGRRTSMRKLRLMKAPTWWASCGRWSGRTGWPLRSRPVAWPAGRYGARPGRCWIWVAHKLTRVPGSLGPAVTSTIKVSDALENAAKKTRSGSTGL